MGNLNSSKINENKLINNNNNSNFNNSDKDYLYEYKCKVEISELDTVEKNEYFTLYLCENHIVLENEYKEFFLYIKMYYVGNLHLNFLLFVIKI